MTRHIPRLYVNAPLSAEKVLPLEEAQAHYLSRVMRMNIADTLKVFNGSDGEWQAEITDIGKKSASVQPKKQLRPQTSEPDVWLCFAPVKNVRAEWIAEKATELGASALQPVVTQHTIVNKVHEEKLLANAIEAAEQCERLTIPQVLPIQKLEKLLTHWPQDRRLLFCDESGGGKQILEALSGTPSGKWAILIGPEGGFSTEEIAHLRTLPYVVSAGLGPRILKADTAALAALACLQNLLNK